MTGGVKQTKADRHISRQQPQKETVGQTLYRATIDFCRVNSFTKSTKTYVLLSIQSIEAHFSDSIVSTLDIRNKFNNFNVTDVDSQLWFWKYRPIFEFYFSLIWDIFPFLGLLELSLGLGSDLKFFL